MVRKFHRILGIVWVSSAFCTSLFGFSAKAPNTLLVVPTNITLVTSGTQQFSASVKGSGAAAVRWRVAGVEGGNSKVGRITPSGLYTAPAVLPPAPVEVSAVEVADSRALVSVSVSIEENPAIEEVHRQWLAGVVEEAAQYGCKPELVQQLPGESVTDALKLFAETAQNGSCLVLAPISSDMEHLRYSFASGGKIDGVEILYLSDVSRIRIREGVEVTED